MTWYAIVETESDRCVFTGKGIIAAASAWQGDTVHGKGESEQAAVNNAREVAVAIRERRGIQ